MLTRRSVLGALGAAATVPHMASAQERYPSRPIRMVVAFPAGGSADINARIVAQQLAIELGGSVVIENRGGAGGNLGAVAVAQAAPDGYTLFYATSAIALARSVYRNPGFVPERDFVPVSLTATIPLVLVAAKSVPANSAQEFLAWLKANPQVANYASSGKGALLHLAAELFLTETGTKATHVPYRGSAPAVNDMLANSVHFMFLPVNEIASHIQAGNLKAIAVTHSERIPQLPNVPTVREGFGLTSMDIGAWQGLALPAKTPAPIIDQVSAALARTLRAPDTLKRLTETGSIILGGTAADYRNYIASEAERWAKVCRDAGISPE
jgi:tripartite-type tricarboxylate transporter receptor subunit TctC